MRSTLYNNSEQMFKACSEQTLTSIRDMGLNQEVQVHSRQSFIEILGNEGERIQLLGD